MCDKTIDQLTRIMEEKLKRLSESIESAADKGAEEIRQNDKEAAGSISCKCE